MSSFSEIHLPTPVEVLCLTSEGPFILSATARSLENEKLLLVLEKQSNHDLSNKKVILQFADHNSPMITMHVLQSEGTRLILGSGQVHVREKRLFPRLYGNIPVRYCRVDPQNIEFIQRQWLQGDISPDDTWNAPEPFMNFSVNGISFEETAQQGQTQPWIQPKDWVLLELGVGDTPQRWRLVARVVRAHPTPNSSPLTCNIALFFENVPQSALDALTNFTLNIQEALF
jgi:hypothetical protein